MPPSMEFAIAIVVLDLWSFGMQSRQKTGHQNSSDKQWPFWLRCFNVAICQKNEPPKTNGNQLRVACVCVV